MYRQESKFENGQEVVMNIEMTVEEMDKIRNESLTNLKECLESGIITKEEFVQSMKEMGIVIEDGELIVERLGYVYNILNLKRAMQSLNYDLEKKIITLGEYVGCKRLIALEVV